MTFLLALIVLVSTCAFAQDTVPPIPGLAQWEAHMKDNARIIRAQPESVFGRDVNEGYIWYYDGIFVFQNYHWSFDYVRWRSVAPEPNRKVLDLKMTVSR